MELKAVIGISGDEYEMLAGMNIRQQTGAISSSSIKVRVPSDKRIPQAREVVEILCDNAVFFRGYISSVETPTFSTGKETPVYKLELDSAERILKNRLVNEAFTNIYTHQIVAQLFGSYIQEEGVELGEISTTTRFWESYNVAYYNLYTALQELADDVGAVFFISPENKFYFMLKKDLEQIDMPSHVKALKRSENADAMITEKTIAGATEETSEQTEQFLWETDANAFQKSLSLAYPVKEIKNAYIGEENGGTMSWRPVGFGSKGVDDEDTTKTFLFTEGSEVLALNAQAVTKPSASVPYVKIVYIGTYDIIVTDTNPSLEAQLSNLTGSSGKIESYTSDDTITTYADADNVAMNALQEASEWTQELSAKCLSLDDTELYQIWHIDNEAARIAGDFVIVERSVEDFGPDLFAVSVKLKNRALFARYGTCLKKEEKVKNSDVLVYKNNVLAESLELGDQVSEVWDTKRNAQFAASAGITEPGVMDGLSGGAYAGFTAPEMEITARTAEAGTAKRINEKPSQATTLYLLTFTPAYEYSIIFVDVRFKNDADTVLWVKDFTGVERYFYRQPGSDRVRVSLIAYGGKLGTIYNNAVFKCGPSVGSLHGAFSSTIEDDAIEFSNVNVIEITQAEAQLPLPAFVNGFYTSPLAYSAGGTKIITGVNLD